MGNSELLLLAGVITSFGTGYWMLRVFRRAPNGVRCLAFFVIGSVINAALWLAPVTTYKYSL